jgi:hypothetical protein
VIVLNLVRSDFAAVHWPCPSDLKGLANILWSERFLIGLSNELKEVHFCDMGHEGSCLLFEKLVVLVLELRESKDI